MKIENNKHKEVHKDKLNRSFLSDLILRIQKMPLPERLLRHGLSKVISMEGGIFYSHTIRQYLLDSYGISLGSYSYGLTSDIFRFRPKTIIGRYVSIGPGVKIFNANHPIDFMSMHPFFYLDGNRGIAKQNALNRHEVVIGHDSWLGANSIICPGCHRVGIGAVIGAGAIVTKDVPDYAVVAGNPAKVIKMRFPDTTIESLLESKWWELSIESLTAFKNDLTASLEKASIIELLEKIKATRRRDGL